MIARIQRCLALAWLLAWVVAGMIASGGNVAAAIVLSLLLTAGHALVLGVEFAWMHRINARDAAPRATRRDVLRAWWTECTHAPRVFLWRQPFRTHCRPNFTPRPGAAAASRGPGVLLVHGFFCNRALWNPWLERLAQEGRTCIAVTLEPPFGSIDQYRSTIEQAVTSLERTTGRRPIVVAHSMGGLALRAWWAVPGNFDRIAHAITLGTPHHGTMAAVLGVTENARQMRPGSAWLEAQRAVEPPGLGTRLTCYYSHTDNIVFPAGTATYTGADNRHLRATPHVAMVDHPAPWAELQRLINP